MDVFLAKPNSLRGQQHHKIETKVTAAYQSPFFKFIGLRNSPKTQSEFSQKKNDKMK